MMAKWPVLEGGLNYKIAIHVQGLLGIKLRHLWLLPNVS